MTERSNLVKRMEKEIEEDAEKIKIVTGFRKKSQVKGNFCGCSCNKRGEAGNLLFSPTSQMINSFKKNKNGFAVKVTVNEVETIAQLEQLNDAKGKVYIS